MPDYSKTVIYKIQHEDNEEMIYVGSTTEFIKRKSHHKSNCSNPKNNLKLYKMIRENGGWECFKMIQILEYPCNNKREAEAKEDTIMMELKANMNIQRANRSIKKWREENKEKISQQGKQYHKNNRERILNYQKEYYQSNKEQLIEKVTCECGCVVAKQHLLRHKKSKKHTKLLNETLKQ